MSRGEPTSPFWSIVGKEAAFTLREAAVWVSQSAFSSVWVLPSC